jgi:hypothetical protein
MNRMMKQHYVSPIRLAPAACGLVMLLGLTVAGIAQQAPVSAAPVAVAAESPNPAKPGSEGIKVHGHWVIDVKNPDGTLAQHRVFENSLKDSGYSLVGLLGGNYVTGDFVVSLTPLTGSGICPSNDCVMVQSLTGLAAGGICSTANCVVGLTKTVNANQGTTPYALILAGQLTASQTGSIGNVSVSLGYCGGLNAPDTTITPAVCATSSDFGPSVLGTDNFTGTNITPITNISPGQIVQVSVTISFS